MFGDGLGHCPHRHHPRPDPQRPPRRQARGPAVAGGAGEDEGVAVGVFVETELRKQSPFVRVVYNEGFPIRKAV